MIARSLFLTPSGLSRFDTLQRDHATPQEMLDLAMGMVKQEVLNEAASRIMQRQWDETPPRRTGN